jgi:hypothetical protein
MSLVVARLGEVECQADISPDFGREVAQILAARPDPPHWFENRLICFLAL